MSTALLEVRGISVRFGGLLAVGDVSMDIKPAEIHGLIGPNGAGKTTLFNAITGLVPPSDGVVIFKGEDVSRLQAHQRACLGMRRTFQAVQLVPQFTVLENVLVGLHATIRDPVIGSLLGLPRSRAGELAAQAKVVEVLDYLGIADTLLRRPDELTFVQQRFVEVARAIVSQPALLMLDEPAAGLSPGDIEKLDALLRRLRDDRGMTILLVEHVLSLVMGISDRVTVLDNGRLICSGTVEQVYADPAVHTAYFGEDHA